MSLAESGGRSGLTETTEASLTGGAPRPGGLLLGGLVYYPLLPLEPQKL